MDSPDKLSQSLISFPWKFAANKIDETDNKAQLTVITMKCGAWCSLKRLPSYNFCNGGGFGMTACLCCSGTKTQPPKPKPPVPSPPPPPPPPRSPLDLCDPSEVSFSSPSPGCPMCPVCNCPGGVPPELSACISNYCSCCCPNTLSSSTRTPGSILFARAH
ncbi:hypothetical protein MKX01_004825 [Papaver californicum]|nr:hypothetical protein MKX01_004825 [Papaver californicum]